MKMEIIERNGQVVQRRAAGEHGPKPVRLWPPLKPDEFIVVRTTGR